MIERRMRAQLVEMISRDPAVALLGPRQAGMTTLALNVADGRRALYLDLESPSDHAKLTVNKQNGGISSRVGAAISLYFHADSNESG
jgi:predicted AAA+ superfamily ATPase